MKKSTGTEVFKSVVVLLLLLFFYPLGFALMWRWVNKSVVVLLLLLFFYPLGFALMWRWVKWSRWIKIVITLVFIVPALFMLAYLFVMQPHRLDGNAMYPNYSNGQQVIGNKLIYRFSSPKRGDVVIFVSPKDAAQTYFKRIIGLPGEKVKIQAGKVYINEIELSESYLAKGVTTSAIKGGFLEEGKTVIIPENNYFVLGDNRPFSYGSRSWGFVPRQNILDKI